MSALFLAGALCAGAFAAVPAEAAKLGPYFPMPAAFPLNGTGKDALLKIQAKWLNDGLGNLEKARKEKPLPRLRRRRPRTPSRNRSRLWRRS